MANLSKLTLAPRPVPVKSDPFEAAKAALLANLERQLTSARAMLDGTPCPDVKRKWYFRDTSGKVRFRMRVGAHTLAIGDGLTDIVAGDDKALPKTIETVISAVKAGELDEPIRTALSTRKPRKAKG
jgi:hypothetical protein